jgi:hypothetical protein
MTDGLSTLYQDLLGGSYDCVDRIVLNAYFRMGHDRFWVVRPACQAASPSSWKTSFDRSTIFLSGFAPKRLKPVIGLLLAARLLADAGQD